MRITNLTKNSDTYTSNAYIVLGEWNTLDDINTLIDTGRDRKVMERLESVNTGVGKTRIEQIVLTHSHYDHSSMLPELAKRYNPDVYAYSKSLNDQYDLEYCVKYKTIIRIADTDCNLIHSPFHSSDSICILCREAGILFSGDVPLVNISGSGAYSNSYYDFLKYLYNSGIETVYPGHGEPIDNNVKYRLKESADKVKKVLGK